MTKEEIRQYVIDEFIKNHRKVLFISDLANNCNTNAKGIRAALDEDLDGFEYFEADRWSGSNFSGRYIQSWAVEPSKSTLIKLIRKD